MIRVQEVNKLIELIQDMVGIEEGSWKEKRDFILDNLDEEEKGALAEFLAWFEDGVMSAGLSGEEDANETNKE